MAIRYAFTDQALNTGLSLDPAFQFSNLLQNHRDSMNNEYRAAYENLADEILRPYNAYILSNGDIYYTGDSFPDDYKEIREQLAQIDADPDDALFDKWAELDEKAGS